MLNEKQISDLLSTLRDVGQPDKVRQQALEQLLQNNEDVQSLLRKEFTANAPGSEDLSREAGNAYDRLWPKLNVSRRSESLQKEQLRTRLTRKWYSIAAVLLICIAGIFLFRYPSVKPGRISGGVRFSPSAKAKSLFDTIWSQGSSTTFCRLQDGSAVQLDAGSYLFFKTNFMLGKKEIFLRGSARFTVHKDPSRPFSVFVGGIEVIDLGTVFSIKTKESLIKVRLIRGKVLIRSANPQFAIEDVGLVPGQEFTADTATRQYSVNFLPGRTNSRVSKLTTTLSFENASLQEVFERIEKECGVSIYFNDTAIKDKAFTGTFETGSNARSIVATICLINDLKYTLRSDKIYISD